MRVSRVVPTVTVSGLSGRVRVKMPRAGHSKALTVAGLRWCVRFVRVILNCLTYARPRAIAINGGVFDEHNISWDYLFIRTNRTKAISV